MSFFEDGDEPPTRAQPRPRRPAPPRSGGGGGGASGRGSGRAPDQQELFVRRLVAGGIILVFVLICFFALRSCASSRTERALKDYNRDAGQIASDSVKNVSEPFFTQLNAGGGDLENKINSLRLTSEEQVKSAQNLNVPDQMKRAQDALELVLNLRTTALGKVAALISSAQSDNAQTAEDAVGKIAGQMQQFLASDVIYSQRVVPYIQGALRAKGISGQSLAQSRSLPDITWLTKGSIAGVLDAKRAGGGTGTNPNPAPGTHGHGLTSTAVGSVALNSSGTNTITTSSNPTFTVKFQNQGENNESDVTVQVTVKPGSGKSITVKKTVNNTTAGQETTVPIALGTAPPFGNPAIVTVTVLKVPGEENTDNNKASYTVLFKRG